jgi:hypothetical protein
MGRKRKERPSVDALFESISRMLVPEYILENFDIYGAEESTTNWIIDLYEREGNIPKELENYSDVVFDGYCNPIETFFTELFFSDSFFLFFLLDQKERKSQDDSKAIASHRFPVRTTRG